jgi:hypothetical protein
VKRTQAANPEARRERPWRELLPPDPRDPDIVPVKALARAACPCGGAAPSLAGTGDGHLAPKPGDVFRPELRLLGAAQQAIDQHVNRKGRCAACASRWPCRLAELAEFALEHSELAS